MHFTIDNSSRAGKMVMSEVVVRALDNGHYNVPDAYLLAHNGRANLTLKRSARGYSPYASETKPDSGYPRCEAAVPFTGPIAGGQEGAWPASRVDDRGARVLVGMLFCSLGADGPNGCAAAAQGFYRSSRTHRRRHRAASPAECEGMEKVLIGEDHSQRLDVIPQSSGSSRQADPNTPSRFMTE